MFSLKKQFFPTVLIVIFIFNNVDKLLSQEYFPNETVWTTLSSSFGILLPETYTSICGDTIINNISYKKVYSSIESDDGGFEGTYHYAMREDGQRIWRIEENNDTEELFYDFGLVVGDIFYVEENGLPLDLIVESVSIENLNGIDRKKIEFQNINSFPGETWYEGIGSNRGFSRRGKGYTTTFSSSLCCLKIENELVFMVANSSYCDCTVGDFDDLGLNCLTISSTENNIAELKIVSLYPNPSNGAVTIQSNSNEVKKMEIYSLTGKLIQSKNIQHNDKIKLELLNKGVFFVKIIDVNTNQFQIEKLVLN